MIEKSADTVALDEPGLPIIIIFGPFIASKKYCLKLFIY